MDTAYLINITIEQFHSDGMRPFRNRDEFREFWMAGELGDELYSRRLARDEIDDLIRAAWDGLPPEMKA
jgi:hypothetical protein